MILGIDFGLKKVGTAIGEGLISEPYKVIRYLSPDSLISELKKIIETEKIEKVVVGVSEGEMAGKSREFIENLKTNLTIPVTEFDETLSTREAIELGIEAGMKRSKRKKMEDAIAAAIMLQNYLDNRIS